MDPEQAVESTYYLHPCKIFVHRQEHLVSTVLGSCVAVCIWDTQSGIGGMNHFMLPLWDSKGLPTPRYGDIATRRLIKGILHLGGDSKHLAAKVFGGANVIPAFDEVPSLGDRNAIVAMENLKECGIPVLACSVGGVMGMRLHFNTRTGESRHTLVSNIW